MTRTSRRSTCPLFLGAAAVALYLTGRGLLRRAVGPVDRLADLPSAVGALMTCNLRPRGGCGQ